MSDSIGPVTSELLVDATRLGKLEYGDFMPTGIYVRAKLNGKWDAYDIVTLDTQSLLTWLRSRGGHNPWAENCVMLLLGHDPIA